MSGRSVNLNTLFLGRLRPPKRLTSTLCSLYARARFDPLKSSVDTTEVSKCVFRDPTKLPPLKCLKNPVNTQLSVKRAWDISVLKCIHRYYRFFTPDNAILSHLFSDHSASLSVHVTTDA